MNWFKIIVRSSFIVLFSCTSLYASDMLLTMPPILAATYEAPVPPVPVNLSAFNDFKNKGGCTSNWGNRDGALGLDAHTGDGTCEAIFTGIERAHTYNIVLTVQAEFDGRSPYRVSINGQVIKEGRFPFSTSSLKCDCKPVWMTKCPDKNFDINLGDFTVKKGDTIEFWGDEDYGCGSHGAYAKWHGISFTPVQ